MGNTYPIGESLTGVVNLYFLSIIEPYMVIKLKVSPFRYVRHLTGYDFKPSPLL
jgi:hypothetical protein